MPAKKQNKLTPTMVVLLVAALIVYGYIAQQVIDSSDPWNSLGTLGVFLLVPVVVVLPIAFFIFWVYMFLESLKRKEYLWSVLIFLIPVVSILYWLLDRQTKRR